VINAIHKFKESVAPEKTRIESLFPLILVFGGDADVTKDKYQSCRSVFLSWAHETKYELANFLRTPEDFKGEWNKFEGYSNLVDFEIDAGCLTRGILLFLECPGALAELGAFCTDEALCERLLVVLAEEYYDVPSFVYLGPVKRIEEEHTANAIYVASSTDDTHVFEKEVSDVGEALRIKAEYPHKKKQFNAKATRDQFLLIADLIELFGALTEIEIKILLEFLGVEPAKLQESLSRMLNQLILFELIVKSRGKTELYYVPPKQRTHYLNYTAPAESKFERAPFKLITIHPELKKDKNRLDAYAKYHGVPR